MRLATPLVTFEGILERIQRGLSKISFKYTYLVRSKESYKQFTIVIYEPRVVIGIGHFLVRYASRVVNYYHRAFIRLDTDRLFLSSFGVLYCSVRSLL